MKFLVLISALVAVALASEGQRVRRGVLGYGGYGHGVGAAVVSGPSGYIAANTGVVAPAYAAPAVIAAPAAYAAPVHAAPVHAAPVVAAPAYATPAVVAPPQTAGVVYGASATVVGPSTDGRPGYIAGKGYGAGVYGLGYYGGHY